jgi:hypothetical protein
MLLNQKEEMKNNGLQFKFLKKCNFKDQLSNNLNKKMEEQVFLIFKSNSIISFLKIGSMMKFLKFLMEKI